MFLLPLVISATNVSFSSALSLCFYYLLLLLLLFELQRRLCRLLVFGSCVQPQNMLVPLSVSLLMHAVSVHSVVADVGVSAGALLPVASAAVPAAVAVAVVSSAYVEVHQPPLPAASLLLAQ